jgi:5-methylthioadenosine/S-adenosylhomocysteine deaminase
VNDGLVLTADEEAVRAEAQAQAEAVARRVATDPVHKGLRCWRLWGQAGCKGSEM